MLVADIGIELCRRDDLSRDPGARHRLPPPQTRGFPEARHAQNPDVGLVGWRQVIRDPYVVRRPHPIGDAVHVGRHVHPRGRVDHGDPVMQPHGHRHLRPRRVARGVDRDGRRARPGRPIHVEQVVGHVLAHAHVGLVRQVHRDHAATRAGGRVDRLQIGARVVIDAPPPGLEPRQIDRPRAGIGDRPPHAARPEARRDGQLARDIRPAPIRRRIGHVVRPGDRRLHVRPADALRLLRRVAVRPKRMDRAARHDRGRGVPELIEHGRRSGVDAPQRDAHAGGVDDVREFPRQRHLGGRAERGGGRLLVRTGIAIKKHHGLPVGGIGVGREVAQFGDRDAVERLERGGTCAPQIIERVVERAPARLERRLPRGHRESREDRLDNLIAALVALYGEVTDARARRDAQPVGAGARDGALGRRPMRWLDRLQVVQLPARRGPVRERESTANPELEAGDRRRVARTVGAGGPCTVRHAVVEQEPAFPEARHPIGRPRAGEPVVP